MQQAIIFLAAVLVLIVLVVLILLIVLGVLVVLVVLIVLILLILLVIHCYILQRFVLRLFRPIRLPRYSGFILCLKNQAGN